MTTYTCDQCGGRIDWPEKVILEIKGWNTQNAPVQRDGFTPPHVDLCGKCADDLLLPLTTRKPKS